MRTLKRFLNWFESIDSGEWTILITICIVNKLLLGVEPNWTDYAMLGVSVVFWLLNLYVLGDEEEDEEDLISE